MYKLAGRKEKLKKPFIVTQKDIAGDDVDAVKKYKVRHWTLTQALVFVPPRFKAADCERRRSVHIPSERNLVKTTSWTVRDNQPMVSHKHYHRKDRGQCNFDQRICIAVSSLAVVPCRSWVLSVGAYGSGRSLS